MKKLILLFCCALTLAAQHYRVGAGFTGGLPNDNVKLSGGFEVFVEYLTESPLSFRTAGGFAISKFSDNNPYLNNVKYSLYWIEGSLVYFPFKSILEPYVAGGLGYYFISADELNEIRTATGNYTPQELNSKMSYNLKAGLSYPVHSSIKLHCQVKYLFLNQNLVVEGIETINTEEVARTTEDKIDLNTLFISAGVIIKI